MPLTFALRPSHLREVPRLLLQVSHLVTVEQLREAADLIVHHAASVVPGASQRAQEELPVFGVASQLRGIGESHDTAAVRGSKNRSLSTGLCIGTLVLCGVLPVPEDPNHGRGAGWLCGSPLYPDPCIGGPP